MRLTLCKTSLSSLQTSNEKLIIIYLLKVFQRRMDGSENFYRTWNDYEIGFGNVGGEHWLGMLNTPSDLY